MIYKLSVEAEIDLQDIWLYTFENWSRDQANRYIDLILDEIEYLCVKPNSGNDYSHLRKGYFRSKVKSHYIFYKVNKKKRVVEVIRILHQMMDIESQLDL
jgi:toxin ParE1/3/4